MSSGLGFRRRCLKWAGFIDGSSARALWYSPFKNQPMPCKMPFDFLFVNTLCLNTVWAHSYTVFFFFVVFQTLLFLLKIENAPLMKGNDLGKEDIITDVWLLKGCSCAFAIDCDECCNNMNPCISWFRGKPGTCVNNYGGYACRCPNGFRGQSCQLGK